MVVLFSLFCSAPVVFSLTACACRVEITACALPHDARRDVSARCRWQRYLYYRIATRPLHYTCHCCKFVNSAAARLLFLGRSLGRSLLRSLHLQRLLLQHRLRIRTLLADRHGCILHRLQVAHHLLVSAAFCSQLESKIVKLLLQLGLRKLSHFSYRRPPHRLPAHPLCCKVHRIVQLNTASSVSKPHNGFMVQFLGMSMLATGRRAPQAPHLPRYFHQQLRSALALIGRTRRAFLNGSHLLQCTLFKSHFSAFAVHQLAAQQVHRRLPLLNGLALRTHPLKT
jgi:hypothetical protein